MDTSEFRNALRRLLLDAIRNGLDIEAAWKIADEELHRVSVVAEIASENSSD